MQPIILCMHGYPNWYCLCSLASGSYSFLSHPVQLPLALYKHGAIAPDALYFCKHVIYHETVVLLLFTNISIAGIGVAHLSRFLWFLPRQMLFTATICVRPIVRIHIVVGPYERRPSPNNIMSVFTTLTSSIQLFTTCSETMDQITGPIYM